MAMCEDYPCCGHTDGLGCDWVSPNEIQLCMVCAEARADRPYHTMHRGDCPTANKRKEAKAGSECVICGESAAYMYHSEPLCSECIVDVEADEAAYRRDYDDYY